MSGLLQPQYRSFRGRASADADADASGRRAVERAASGGHARLPRSSLSRPDAATTTRLETITTPRGTAMVERAAADVGAAAGDAGAPAAAAPLLSLSLPRVATAAGGSEEVGGLQRSASVPRRRPPPNIEGGARSAAPGRRV